jgi:outer membrane receptor for ferrienterochelin and colicins
MILLKSNGGGSTVRGLSLEGRLNYNDYVELNLGFTLQKSQYDQAVQWSADLEGTSDFLRTPNNYAYYTMAIYPLERISVSLSGVYTGTMLVPHYGGAPGVPMDEVINSKAFFDQNVKLSYELPIASVRQNISFFGGVKNIFNSYQNDFDTGRYRDSNFVYGPARPGTVYFGIKLESL